jgi:asparagine synthase (glutamine-hydrolysing)
MFEGIKALMPGHYAIYDIASRSLEIKRWYNPKPVSSAYENIEQRIIAAIDRVKLTCDWPQTILLSGGIDSTMVASRYVGNGAIHLRSPEQSYAEQVAEKFNLSLKVADPEEVSAEECLIDYVTKCGDPTMAGLIPYITCKEISKLGYRVAITANGADELFYGYDRMRWDRKEQIDHIFRPLGQNLEAISQNSAQNIELNYYLMHDLNKTLDFASMCHSVEVRVPYLDHELVEVALSIPQDLHLQRFGNKSILKKILNKLGFDWDFIQRPKVGFSLHYWPKDWGSLQQKAMEWYLASSFQQLPASATPRQQSYHEITVTGLYVFLKVYDLKY